MNFQTLYKMEKRFKKIERQYNAAGPVARKRILKTAESLQNRMDRLKKVLYTHTKPTKEETCQNTLATEEGAKAANLTPSSKPAQTTPGATMKD